MAKDGMKTAIHVFAFVQEIALLHKKHRVLSLYKASGDFPLRLAFTYFIPIHSIYIKGIMGHQNSKCMLTLCFITWLAPWMTGNVWPLSHHSIEVDKVYFNCHLVLNWLPSTAPSPSMLTSYQGHTCSLGLKKTSNNSLIYSQISPSWLYVIMINNNYQRKNKYLQYTFIWVHKLLQKIVALLHGIKVWFYIC